MKVWYWPTSWYDLLAGFALGWSVRAGVGWLLARWKGVRR